MQFHSKERRYLIQKVGKILFEKQDKYPRGYSQFLMISNV